jgi:hypothetical protein
MNQTRAAQTRLRDHHSVGLTVLTDEAVDADGMRCSECGDTGPRDKLFIYSTVIGSRVRVHDGLFCSKLCHDMFHGLHLRR